MEVNNYFAFDTETNKGKAFCITLANNNSNEYIEINKFSDVNNFFKNLFFRKLKIGFCFNLDYDVLALLSYIDNQQLISVYTATPIKIGDYYYTYLKNKCLRVSKSSNYNSPCINIYDIQQFYNTTLEEAATKFLKNKTKIDIGKARGNDILAFSKTNFIEFKKYAIQDAILTYELGMLIANELPTITKFYSAGYIVFELHKNLNNGYKIDKKTDIFMRKYFVGARIEILKKGSFKKAFIYDIKSAYPSIIADLYDIIAVKFSDKIDKAAKYNFIECNITIPDIYNIGFCPIRNDVLQFCCGTFDTMLDNESMNYYLTKGAKINKIHSVLNVYCTNKQPYKKTVNELFLKRKNNDFSNYFYKLLLNSCYGKKAERRKKYSPINIDEFDNLKSNLILYQSLENQNIDENFEYDLTKIKKQYFKIDRSERGKHYNIIEASIILNLTRLKLLKFAFSVGVENVIGFMTDSIMTTKPLDNSQLGTELGSLQLQEQTDLLVIGSGVYQTENKTKMRGYNSKLDLKTEFSKKENLNNSEIDIEALSRHTLGKYLRAKDATPVDLIELNELNEINKILKLNFDKKRIWEHNDLNCNDFLTKNFNSTVIKI